MRDWNRTATAASGLAAVLTCALAVGCGGTGSSGVAANPGSDSFSSFSTADGSTPAGRRVAAVGSGLRLFMYPDAANTPVLAAIQGAKKTVDVQVYMMTDDDLVQALIAASKPPRNVRVRVLLEPNPFTGTPGPSPSPGASPSNDPSGGGSFNPNSKAMRSFRGTPVQADWSSPQFVYTHEKAMIVDKGLAKQSVWIMTANMSKAARLNNREFLIQDSDSDDITEAQHIFDSDWSNTTYTPGPAAEHLVISPNNSRAQLLALVDSATQTLSIGVESYGDPEFQQHLIARAKARVKVQVLLADPTKYPNSPIPALAKELQANGCVVKYINKPYYHAKVIIADNTTVYTGSINFSTNSMNNNRELGILYSQGDIVQQVARTYAQDFAAGTDIGGARKLSDGLPSFNNNDEQFYDS